jgi:PPE-repeat protein
MNAKFFVFALTALVVFIAACEDMGDPVSTSTPSPTITSISPDSGNVGDTVNIIGNKFTATTGSVKFGGVSATVFAAWTDTLIRVQVPPTAVTGSVIVTVNGKSSNSKPFKVIGTAAVLSFAADIKPLFTTWRCNTCHPGNGGFDVTSYSTIMNGGAHGAVIIAGNGEGSNLVKKLRPNPPFGARMPQDGATNGYMTNSDIQKISDWITQGALDN